MILQQIKNIIKEDYDGDITIRGYNVKVTLPDFEFRLKASHLAKPIRYVLQELFPEKYKVSEKELTYISKGKIIDNMIQYIWEELRKFYINDNIRSIHISLLEYPPDIAKIGKKILSIFSLLFSLGFEPFQYSMKIAGSPSRMPLQYTGIRPDILLRKEDKGLFIGDVKYGLYRKEYRNVITAYAMIFEELTKKDVDYGVLIHINHNLNFKIELFKINDMLRSETIELVREKYFEVNKRRKANIQ